MVGDTRWTIVRHLAPARRRQSEAWNRRRVEVRCVCGHQTVLWLDDLVAGRTSGCRSHRCAARFEAAREIVESLGPRFVAAHKMQDRLATWLAETGRRDRLEMREALECDDDDSPPTRACVR